VTGRFRVDTVTFRCTGVTFLFWRLEMPFMPAPSVLRGLIFFGTIGTIATDSVLLDLRVEMTPLHLQGFGRL
jgi:hypothetical protein